MDAGIEEGNHMHTDNLVIHSEYDENGLSIQEIILSAFHDFMVLETTSATGYISIPFPDKTDKTEV